MKREWLFGLLPAHRQNRTSPTDNAVNSWPYAVSSTLHGLYFT